jgi:hypothetical protein
MLRTDQHLVGISILGLSMAASCDCTPDSLVLERCIAASRPVARPPKARDHGIALLACGNVLGGPLLEKFLGRPEPRRDEFDTASLQKYKNMIDAWGGWPLFQGIARRAD